MPFELVVELARDVFDAGWYDDESRPEWPPHPARVFGAMVSVAETDEDRDALRWLESQDPPRVEAGRSLSADRRAGYVVTNQMVGGTHYQGQPARQAKGPRTWCRTVPADPTVVVCWTADPPPAMLERLDSLARRVPYLGRSTSPALLRFRAAPDEQATNPDRLVWRPAEGGRDLLGVPRPGYLDELVMAFDEGESAWTVNRSSVRYSTDAEPPTEEAALRGAYGELMSVGFPRGVRLDAQLTLQLTKQLRRALVSVLDGGPAALHGHTDSKEPHHQVCVCALPFVDFPHADGHLMGLALAMPRDLVPEDRAEILRALVAVDELRVAGLGAIPLTREVASSERRSTTLDPGHWTRASTEWVTAIPMVSDRFLRGGERVAEVARACSHVGLPEPEEIEVSENPLLDGAPTIKARHRVRRRGDVVRPAWHVRLRFDKPGEGPIVLGHLRHYGLGLCLPRR